MINNHPIRPISQTSPFYLLDNSIKPICQIADEGIVLAEKIEECDALIKKQYGEKSFTDIVNFFSSLKNEAEDFFARVDKEIEKIESKTECTDDKVEYKYLSTLRELRFHSEEKLEKCLNMFNQPDDAKSTLLKRAVNEAYEGYKSKQSSWHHKILFPASNEIKEVKDIINKESPSASKLVADIDKCYHNSSVPGRFKEILTDHLKKLLPGNPINELTTRLNALTPEPTEVTTASVQPRK